MNKISVMDEESKNIEIYNLSYNESEMIDYINNIKDIGLTHENEIVHVANYEETKLKSTDDLKQYLFNMLRQDIVDLKEINKLVKSDSPIRNAETLITLKEFMNKIAFNLDIKVPSNEANKIARQLMLAEFDKVQNEDIESLAVSFALNNREAFNNMGFSINSEKNKTR